MADLSTFERYYKLADSLIKQSAKEQLAECARLPAAPPILVDHQTGKYLGNLSANPYDPNSTSNPYGRYGSEYSQDSVNNPYGKYGSPYNPDSVNNPYATGGGTPRNTYPADATPAGSIPVAPY